MDILGLPWLRSAPPDFRQRCKHLKGRSEDIAGELRELASFAVDATQLKTLARLASEHPQGGGPSLRPFRLGLVSNSTTDLLAPGIVASGLRHGLRLEVAAAPYDQVMQSVADPGSPLYAQPLDAVLLALDHRAFAMDSAGGVQGALAFVKNLRQHVAAIAGVPVIVQTVARPAETLLGSLDFMLEDMTRALAFDFNGGLRGQLQGSADVLFDVAGLAELVGLTRWHDPVRWHIAKLSFAQACLPLYCEHLARLIAAMRGLSRKCLVLDLDNTLWGGVIGDDGLDGIRLGQGDAVGEAFLAIQRHALSLSKRGGILAVCSKNNDEIAREPFRRHSEMVLREEHIAVFQANWSDKPTNLRAIAKTLNIGIDSLVFLDDNPAERDIVRQSLPQVAVPELGDDPAHYPLLLAAAGYFEAVTLSADDLKRGEYYRLQAQRASLQESATDLDGFLRSLEMKIAFARFDSMGRPRIAQLINKSNQFNLTTRRRTEAEVEGLERDPGYFTMQVRLADRFGDNGMISVIVCRKAGTEWEMDTWLMSCRVLGRRVEHAILNEIVAQARQQGAEVLRGVYIPTDRNSMVKDLYPKLGFKPAGEADGATLWTLDIADYKPFALEGLFQADRQNL